MKIGFGLPVSGAWATPGNMVRVAQRAEELGYESVWTFQRLLAQPDGPIAYDSVHDPLVPLAFVAGATHRIRLGVAVWNMPFISPVVLAKQLSSVDIVCGGRLDAGLGNGWQEAEFEAVGTTRHGLGKRADAFIGALKHYWAVQDPKPVQRPHPPLLLGGGSPAALSRAGRLCDGWISSSSHTLEDLAEAIRVVKAASPRPDRLRFIARVPPRAIGRLDQMAELGMTEAFIDLNFSETPPTMDDAERILETYAPR
ncbi:LLM class flavin-dependent oxidoreductase [Allorhizocola rhizosphaerae]|uniref:LLM class flavin-dependent oxidoreductase n=1 Tax=Allorhizocola rhizosphaerae TaxID=1872709 RepID=UPI000E3D620E|nr:LLM class flavin-dependent oxidoreductase [Allorhizocola rhizosphaerae]